MWNRIQQIHWNNIIKRTFAGVLIFVVYVVAGALLPFASPHLENPEILSQYNPEDYYSEDISCDRAYIVEDNKEALDIRIKMFEEAKDSIVMSTFDIREGESFKDIAACMLAAADRGVNVKILVDGMYGMINMGDGDIFYALGTHKNVQIKYYNQPNILLPWTANGRMHDKYIIIDNKLLLMGGRNTFDYFLGEYEGKGTGYDREVLVFNTQDRKTDSGSVIEDVWEYFDGIWNKSVCRIKFSKAKLFGKTTVNSIRKQLSERYESICSSERNAKMDYQNTCIAINKATFVHNPTTIYAKEPLVWYQMKVLMLNAAKRIIIQTPYAVFSDEMYDGMKEITGRQPATKLLINSVAVGDNVMASSDYVNNRDELLQTGAQIYEYFGEHSCHAKSLIVDDDISVIGSYNFDMRSTYLDTETMLVINGREFTEMLQNKFEAIEKESLLVNRDGEYEASSGVAVKNIKKDKKLLINIVSKAIQLVRFLV